VSLQFGVQLFPVGFVVPFSRVTMYDVPIWTGETIVSSLHQNRYWQRTESIWCILPSTCHPSRCVGFQTCQCLTSKSASHWHDGLPFIPLFLRVPIWFRPSCYYRYWFVSIQCHSLIGVDVLWCVALTLFHPYSLLQSSIFSTVFLRTALRQLRT